MEEIGSMKEDKKTKSMIYSLTIVGQCSTGEI